MGVWDMAGLFGAVAGLFLPGYLLARALSIPAAWAAAMPLSALAICTAVVVLDRLNVAITAGSVGLGLAALSLAAAIGCRRLGAGAIDPKAVEAAGVDPAGVEVTPGRDPLRMVLFAFCGVVSLLVALRVTLEPLAGWDTPFRWDWLARCLLAEQSLDFYPPRTAADFEIYPYPDGLPPLVASVYWWLYAAVGRPLPAVTAIAVATQFVSLLGLVYKGAGADLLWGGRAGWMAAALVAGCPLVIWAVAIGQETGYTPLAATAVLTAGLWAWSTGFTAGGVWYSLRVLAPTMVALALLAPAATGVWRHVPAGLRTKMRRVGGAVAVLAGGFAAVAAAVFPLDIAFLPQAGGLAAIPARLVHRRPDPLDDQGRVKALMQTLEGSSIPDCRILTDNVYLAVVLRHSGSRFQPVMVWSPEVRFLFDGLDSVAAARRDLATRRIFLAMISTDFVHWKVLGRCRFSRRRADLAAGGEPRRRAARRRHPGDAERVPRGESVTGALMKSPRRGGRYDAGFSVTRRVRWACGTWRDCSKRSRVLSARWRACFCPDICSREP